jgi:hypothetical protein
VNPQDLQQDLNFVVPIFLANFFTFISNIFVRFYRIPPLGRSQQQLSDYQMPLRRANVASKWNTNLNPNSLYKSRPSWLISKTAWVLGFRVIAKNHMGMMINIDCNICSRGPCEITNLFSGILCCHCLLWYGEESSNLVRSESCRNNVVLGSVSSSRIFTEPRQLGEPQQQISCSSYVNSSPGASNVMFGKDYNAIFAPCCNHA